MLLSYEQMLDTLKIHHNQKGCQGCPLCEHAPACYDMLTKITERLSDLDKWRVPEVPVCLREPLYVICVKGKGCIVAKPYNVLSSIETVSRETIGFFTEEEEWIPIESVLRYKQLPLTNNCLFDVDPNE